MWTIWEQHESYSTKFCLCRCLTYRHHNWLETEENNCQEVQLPLSWDLDHNRLKMESLIHRFLRWRVQRNIVDLHNISYQMEGKKEKDSKWGRRKLICTLICASNLQLLIQFQLSQVCLLPCWGARVWNCWRTRLCGAPNCPTCGFANG